MPASRSRTERWLDCLHQVYERGGGLELSLARGSGESIETRSADLVWRVRILRLGESDLVVEAPNTMGRSLAIEKGVGVVSAFSIGQNRWMFESRVLERFDVSPGRGAIGISALRLAMPDRVERCSRRNFYRMSTNELRLPMVECWPLRDPTTAVAAEIANRALVMDLQNREPTPRSGEPVVGSIGTTEPVASLVLPDVGPGFKAQLVNLGGGGAGLLVDRSESQGLDRARHLWIRLDLQPDMPAPIGITARCVHTHLDSSQNTYAGLAFDFTFNPAHRDFIVNQVTGYINRVMERASQAKAA